MDRIVCSHKAGQSLIETKNDRSIEDNAFEPWRSVFDSSGLRNTPKQRYCASIGHVVLVVPEKIRQ